MPASQTKLSEKTEWVMLAFFLGVVVGASLMSAWRLYKKSAEELKKKYDDDDDDDDTTGGIAVPV
jgi:hypothetical protein